MQDPRSAFLEWLREQGGYVHPALHFAHDNASGWGLYTKEPLREGTEALRIPRALVLHPKLCHKTLCLALGKNDAYETLSPRDWMLLYLIVQHVADSSAPLAKFSTHIPYVRLIPRNTLTPLNFSEPELELLEGTTLYHSALQRKNATFSSAQRVKFWINELPLSEHTQALRAFLDVDWISMWIWAENAYASRSFPPQVAGWPKEDEPVLIPGFDLLNHRRGEAVTWSFDEPGESVFIFRRSFAKGEQVYNNYGAKSNEELCGSYGFVETDGTDDVLILALRTGEDEAPQVFYWPRIKADPPPSLLEALGKRAEVSDSGDIAQLLSEVHVIESLEKMLRQRRKIFNRVQNQVDDAVPYTDGQVQVRHNVLDMIRTYRAGQASMLDKGVAWVETKLDQLLDELEKKGWTP